MDQRASGRRHRQLAGSVAIAVLGASLVACGGEASPTVAPAGNAAATMAPATGTTPGQPRPLTPTMPSTPASTERASAPAAPTAPTAEAPRDLAPELGAMDGWYNSEPLTLAALRGQPVLLVFWSTI